MNETTPTVKEPIVPKGKLTKIWAVILSVFSAPDMISVVLNAGQTFTESASQEVGLAIALGKLISVLGVSYGIIRRKWLK